MSARAITFSAAGQQDKNWIMVGQPRIYSLGTAWEPIVTDSSGFMTGISVYPGGGGGPWSVISEVDSTTGLIKFEMVFLAPDGGSQVATLPGMAYAPSGNFYLGGAINTGLSNRTLLIKLNSSGVVLWYRTLESSAVLRGIAIDSSENIYCCGAKETGTSNALILKYDTNGNLLWQRRLTQDPLLSIFDRIALDQNSNAYVSGYMRNADGYSDILVAKYNSSGTLQWQRVLQTFVGAESCSDECYSLAVDSAGNSYVAAQSLPTTTANAKTRISVAKYNTSGVFQWGRQFFDAAIWLYPYCVAIRDNSIYVTSASWEDSINTSEGYFIKLDLSGNVQWTRKLTAVSHPSRYGIEPAGVAVNASGVMFVHGYHYPMVGSGDNERFICKLNSDGGGLGPLGPYVWATASLSSTSSGFNSVAGGLTDLAESLTPPGTQPSLSYPSLKDFYAIS